MTSNFDSQHASLLRRGSRFRIPLMASHKSLLFRFYLLESCGLQINGGSNIRKGFSCSCQLIISLRFLISQLVKRSSSLRQLSFDRIHACKALLHLSDPFLERADLLSIALRFGLVYRSESLRFHKSDDPFRQGFSLSLVIGDLPFIPFALLLLSVQSLGQGLT